MEQEERTGGLERRVARGGARCGGDGAEADRLHGGTIRRRGAWGVVLDGAEHSDVGAPQGTTPYSPRSGLPHCQLPELAGPVVFLSRMDLVQQVVGNLEISEDKAEKGIGALLMALRASLDRAAFDDVDRKSTRLNSSHLVISYAVFCLKKKKTNKCTTL